VQLVKNRDTASTDMKKDVEVADGSLIADKSAASIVFFSARIERG